MHYGGNLICHDRFDSEVVGSGNSAIGLARIEAMNSQRRGQRNNAIANLSEAKAKSRWLICQVLHSVECLFHRDHAVRRRKDSRSNRLPFREWP